MNCNILDFGAVADGVTLNTSAIQAAIDHCAESGGGRVTVPTGIFKTGTIWLRSKVELHLESGSELLASDNMDDYNETDAYEQNFDCLFEDWVGKHLIIAHEIENCAITGSGRINGNCQAFVTEEPSPEGKTYGWCHGVSRVKDAERLRPGQLICFIESKNVKVFDVNWLTYLRSPLDEELFGTWNNKKRDMWSTPGYLLSAGKYVTEGGEIVDIDSVSKPLYHYTPVSVEASDDGIVEWKDTSESNIGMFENIDPEKFEKAMAEVIKKLLSTLPDIQ